MLRCMEWFPESSARARMRRVRYRTAREGLAVTDEIDGRKALAGTASEIQAIADELVIEPLRDGVFRAQLPGFFGQTFGGTALGCAALAAAHGCDGRALHSLHAYFLRRIPPDVEIELHVEKLSEGRRLAHRRVQLRLAGRVLCEVSASFAAPQAGVQFQEVAIDPDVPAPEALTPDVDLAKKLGWEDPPPPVEWRWVEYPSRELAPGEAPVCRGWARPRLPLPDDTRVHEAALAYLTDWASQGAIQRRFAPRFEPQQFVSLDHSIWVHQPVRWDDWWLITAHSPIASAGRALTQREIYTRDGRRLATIAQEALILEPSEAAAPRG
jgi:acyl-CoA thioesterase-2